MASWRSGCATGSGKTLLMHVNILQYRHYLEMHGRRGELNRIILLTPERRLSKQHLREFELSGIEAELFTKDGTSLFAGQTVEIIDIHKLREESGEKTSPSTPSRATTWCWWTRATGAPAAEDWKWMRRVTDLCEHGFSFEYSATFGQAMKASSNKT